MGVALKKADAVRVSTIKRTSKATRSSFSQYLTPPQTASLATSLFSDCEAPSCLDLGSGTGILSIALFERFGKGITIDAIDLDADMLSICDAELSAVGVEHTVYLDDALTTDSLGQYDRIILNPPYKKMSADDERQSILPTRSPNLYTAFLMVAVEHLKKNGECVAIIPRSWMNGQYFQPFREWLLEEASLDAIHVYGSRSEIFADTDVLQETMLVKLSKRSQSDSVCVSESQKKNHKPVAEVYKFSELVDSVDHVVRIKPAQSASCLKPLREQGFCASTGKVVDFRAGEYIRDTPGAGINRLIYAHNFPKGTFLHPLDAGKPQWFEATDDTSKRQLIGPGSTVVVKRFSAKEEKRRVTAFYLDMDEPTALENHLNYIHQGTPRKTVLIDEKTAKGLVVWLSTSWVDNWFRDVSGSTQVNAGDLNKMPTPTPEKLRLLGLHWKPSMTTEDADAIAGEVVFDGK